MDRHILPVLACGDWKRRIAPATWASLSIIAAVLAWRRFAGALVEEIPASALCAITTIGVLLSLVAWFLKRSAPAAESQPLGRISAGTFTLLPPFALGVSLLPGHSVTALCYLVALFFLTAGTIIMADERSGIEVPASRETALNPGPWPLDSRRGPTVLQSMTRTTTDHGGERIVGRLRLHFAAGQTLAVTHLAFCPPLAAAPEVACHLLDDSPVRLKVGPPRPYGVRIEARRSQTTERPLNVEVGFSALTAAAQLDAA